MRPGRGKPAHSFIHYKETTMQKLQFIIGGSQAFIRLGKNPALILGEFNKDAPGFVALQEAISDWNEKQAYIAQYAAEQTHEDAPPAPDA